MGHMDPLCISESGNFCIWTNPLWITLRNRIAKYYGFYLTESNTQSFDTADDLPEWSPLWNRISISYSNDNGL
jgi:hypothetical protein